MLLPGETELSRVLTYERGLPERYRVKCAERRFPTLAEATTALLAAWNVREGARGAHATLHHTASTDATSPVRPDPRLDDPMYARPTSAAAPTDLPPLELHGV